MFVSHGTEDQVLPMDRCSPASFPPYAGGTTRSATREFEGSHEVPADIAEEGLTSLIA